MRRRHRILFTICAVFGGIIAVGLLGTWWILQSTWLRDTVRTRIVSELERTTGGQVELGEFQYDWRTLTAEFRNLVVHGSEPPSQPPLLHVASARITLKIISLVERDVDIASLVIERPEVHLLARADGTTNIPAPRFPQTNRKSPMEELLDLKVRRFALSNGVATVDEQRVPLNLRGEGLRLLVHYERRRPRYEAEIHTEQLQISSAAMQPPLFALNARAQLERDQITVQQLSLASGGSNLQASGAIRHLAQPQMELQMNGSLALSEVARIMNFKQIDGGLLSFHGTGSYNSTNGLAFNGNAEARQLSYTAGAQRWRDVNLNADVLASKQELALKHLVVNSRGAKLTGEANIARYRELKFDGKISRLPLAEIAGHFIKAPFPPPFPWAGTVEGPVHVTATLDRKISDLSAQTQVGITPSSGGIPISGEVLMSYRHRGKQVQFGNSHLNLPNSQLSFSGAPGRELQLKFDSTNLEDLRPAFALFPKSVPNDALPILNQGTAHFDGVLRGTLIDGQANLSHFRFRGEQWDDLRSKFKLDAETLDVASFDLRKRSLHTTGSGNLTLSNWSTSAQGPLRLDARFQGVNLATDLKQIFPEKLPLTSGAASGSVQIAGSLDKPSGSGHVVVDKGEAYGERLDSVQLDAAFEGDRILFSNGHARKGAAVFDFSGEYAQPGALRVKLDSNTFALSSLDGIRRYGPGLEAEAQIHAEATARIVQGRIEPLSVAGRVEFRDVKLDNIRYGNMALNATTANGVLRATLNGDLEKTPLRGAAQAQLTGDVPATGDIHFGNMSLATLAALSGPTLDAPIEGSLEGDLHFEGPLRRPERSRATLAIEQLRLASRVQPDTTAQPGTPDLALKNAGPILIEAANGVARIRTFKLEGNETNVSLAGSVPYLEKGAGPADLKLSGSVNLNIFHLFDPNVQSSGTSTISASIGGTLRDPTIDGTLAVKDGSFLLASASNGLTAVNGTVVFNRNRATLQKITAKSGGGDLSLGGFISFGGNGPLVYHLEGNAQDVRVRYAGSISVTANSALRLSGTSTSSILSGTLTISRVVFNTNTDVGPLLASFSNATATPPSDSSFLNGLHLDITVESAPNMQFSTALSRDVEAEINLQLRGTPDHPILLGSLAANQGDIRVFGTRYSINRGEISFFNSVKIEPVLDLDLETQTRGITVDITIAGTLNKLNITYRSDPPLQPRDIIALLTVGRTPDAIAASSNGIRSPASRDANTLQSGANSLLGYAVSPTSNRLSRLFGITNIKIDPLVQGITNTPQARLTLEQQISRDITITYITNLSQTSEQVFRLEWALNRQFSVVALRDDNGEFGIDFLYKKRFK